MSPFLRHTLPYRASLPFRPIDIVLDSPVPGISAGIVLRTPIPSEFRIGDRIREERREDGNGGKEEQDEEREKGYPWGCRCIGLVICPRSSVLRLEPVAPTECEDYCE
jgi:hypothetical protein